MKIENLIINLDTGINESPIFTLKHPARVKVKIIKNNQIIYNASVFYHEWQKIVWKVFEPFEPKIKPKSEGFSIDFYLRDLQEYHQSFNEKLTEKIIKFFIDTPLKSHPIAGDHIDCKCIFDYAIEKGLSNAN